MTQPKFIDAVVTHHYHIPTRNVGDMYQKYIDDKVFPQKPADANELILTTNRLGKIDTDLGTLVYDSNTRFPDDNKQILQLSKAFEVGSPYSLYKVMDMLNAEKDQYLLMQYTWIRVEKRCDDFMELKKIGVN